MPISRTFRAADLKSLIAEQKAIYDGAGVGIDEHKAEQQSVG